MKNKILLAVLVALASPLAIACESLVGAWELSYAVYKDENGKVVYEIKDGNDKSIKVLSQQHFSFITQSKEGKFAAAGAGTWSVKGDKYTEVITYASLDRLMNKTYSFNCQMKDGVWIHTGKEDHVFIEEHWKPAK